MIVIELKNTLSLAVMEQAYDWIGAADYVFVGVPKARRGSRSDFSARILKDYGIGILDIDVPTYERYERKPKFEDTSKEITMKKLNNFYGSNDFGIDFTIGKRHLVTRKNVFKNLFVEHQQWLDGGSASSAGKYVTPYALLMKDVYDYMRKQLEDGDNDGWVSAKQIWEHLKANSKPIVVNHYVNPKQSIGSALRKYEKNDIQSIMMGNKNFYKLEQDSEKYIFGIKE